MMKALGITIVALATACIQPKQKPKAVAKPVAVSARPFDRGPTATLVDQNQEGASFRVQIAADITRDVMPTDDLAIVVSVNDEEVGRYPIVGRFTQRPTRIKQEIELPLGDYQIEYVYQGTRYAGMPFRLAEVPVWGGRRALQLRTHFGTRVSLREKKLWVGRWWANDGLPQAWIIEWVREGKVVTMTSGREQHGIPPQTARLVGGANGAFHSETIVNNTIWTYGEEYGVPDVVAQQPGVWAARVVHGNSAPVAVVFNVMANGRLQEQAPLRVVSAGWEESWSKPLEARALSVTEVERLSAKLPKISANEAFDEPTNQQVLEPAIRLSLSAVRALFRSKQLAEAWSTYNTLNVPSSYVALHPGLTPAAAGKRNGVAEKPREMPGNVGERRARLKLLRTQIDQLIKQHGGPWKSEEFPRS
ncbi:MAG TPA: hypothetical protein VIV11_08965 [Kofleriaceae bacterium]